MSLTKFIIRPDNSSYSATDGKEVVSVALDGGSSRYRRDILGASSIVNVQWVCDREEFHYIRAFFRSLTGKGALPFAIDLILDNSLPVEHKAYFIPGSMVLTGQRGLSYYVSAQLEVEPVDIDEDMEIDYVIMFNEFGDEASMLRGEDLLNELVNVLWPGAVIVP
jgi:hypothetical protein